MSLFKNILAATDFSKNSEKVMEIAKDMAKLNGATLHVVHVIDSPEFPITLANFDDITTQLEQHAETCLNDVRNDLKAAGISYSDRVKHGVPADNLLEYADENGVDLIVVGIHGHSKLETFLFGSTTERLLRKSHCPVLTVRC